MPIVERALHLSNNGTQAVDDRRWLQTLYGSLEGPLSAAALYPSKGAGNTVDIAPGSYVVNSSQADQGAYIVQTEGVTTINLTPFTVDRTDQIIARVYDEATGDGQSLAAIEVLEDVDGGTVLPNNSVIIASIFVAGGQSYGTDSVIDQRNATLTLLNTDNDGAGSSLLYFGDYNSTTPTPSGVSTDLPFIGGSFEASTGQLYKISMNFGTWITASFTSAEFAIRLNWTNALGNPSVYTHVFTTWDNVDETSATYIQGNLTGTVDVSVSVLPQGTLTKDDQNAPLQVWVEKA